VSGGAVNLEIISSWSLKIIIAVEILSRKVFFGGFFLIKVLKHGPNAI
jgi:hypothetical protein